MTDKVILALAGPAGSILVALQFGLPYAAVFVIFVAMVLAWALVMEKSERIDCNQALQDFLSYCRYHRR